jgi:hypothetical protein
MEGKTIKSLLIPVTMIHLRQKMKQPQWKNQQQMLKLMQLRKQQR